MLNDKGWDDASLEDILSESRVEGFLKGLLGTYALFRSMGMPGDLGRWSLEKRSEDSGKGSRYGCRRGNRVFSRGSLKHQPGNLVQTPFRPRSNTAHTPQKQPRAAAREGWALEVEVEVEAIEEARRK